MLTSKGYYTRPSVKVVLLLENKEDTSLADHYCSSRLGEDVQADLIST